MEAEAGDWELITFTGVCIDDVPDELELEKVLEVEKLRLSIEDFLFRRRCANLAFTTSCEHTIQFF